MHKKILILVAVIAVFGFGSATALLIPVGFTTSDNVKLYTKTSTFNILGESTGGFELFCDAGDTIINGFAKDTIVPVDQHSILESNAINTAGLDGWKVRMSNANAVAQTFEGVIVCAKVIPTMGGVIGGMLLQPDDTALFLAYGISNAVWMAPLALGVGAGVYLTKSKLKKKNG